MRNQMWVVDTPEDVVHRDVVVLQVIEEVENFDLMACISVQASADIYCTYVYLPGKTADGAASSMLALRSSYPAGDP